MPFAIALVTLPFWIFFAVFFFKDLYLSYDFLNNVVRILLPVAVGLNAAGVVWGVVVLVKKRGRKGLTIASLVMNTTPLACIGALYFWWHFIFRM